MPNLFPSATTLPEAFLTRDPIPAESGATAAASSIHVARAALQFATYAVIIVATSLIIASFLLTGLTNIVQF
jgi:hypothetical protein